MRAQEFYSAFEISFVEAAAQTKLTRSRGKALKWKFRCPDASTLSIGFRLNQKNLPGYPGEFMPAIAWNGPLHNARDDGEVSFYQYTSSADLDALQALQKQVVENFVESMHLEKQAQNTGSLVGLLAARSQQRIVPNFDHWLPYWQPEDAVHWGRLFGAILVGWLPKFISNPETREAWCWRVLWSSEKKA